MPLDVLVPQDLQRDVFALQLVVNLAQSGSARRRWPCLVPTSVKSRASNAVSVSSTGNGQFSPATASRFKVSRTGDGATPPRRRAQRRRPGGLSRCRIPRRPSTEARHPPGASLSSLLASSPPVAQADG